MAKLVWYNDIAHGPLGWRYMIQTERIRGEGTFHSLLLSPPGESVFYDNLGYGPTGHRITIKPPVPDVRHRGGEGTIRFCKLEAQAHADLFDPSKRVSSPLCSNCRGQCVWVEDWWVCLGCGDEWCADHDPVEYAAPWDRPVL